MLRLDRALRELRSLQSDLALSKAEAIPLMVHIAKAIQQIQYAKACQELPAGQERGPGPTGISFAQEPTSSIAGGK